MWSEEYIDFTMICSFCFLYNIYLFIFMPDDDIFRGSKNASIFNFNNISGRKVNVVGTLMGQK